MSQQQTQQQTQPFGTMIPYDEVSSIAPIAEVNTGQKDASDETLSQAPIAEAKTGQKDIYDGVGYY